MRELPEGVFTVAEGRSAGATRATMRGKGVLAPAHGVRSSVPLTTVAERCAALLHRIGPHAFACGPTAALLWGMPLAHRWQARTRVDIGVASPSRAPHARGIAGRSLKLDGPCDVVTTSAGALTSPARTWCDLGTVLDLPDLVAAGDFLLHNRAVTAREVEAAVARFAGRRGARRLREAVRLLDPRAESRPESLVRVALVLAGIPGVEANVEIRGEDGAFLGRADLCLRVARLVIEYHGDYHRTEPGRWRRDIARAGRMRAAGWTVLELTGDDLRDLDGVVARVRAAARLPHSPPRR